MPEHLTRRRVLTILCLTAAGLAAAGARSLTAVMDYEWRGVAMGAEARMRFCGGSHHAISAVVGSTVFYVVATRILLPSMEFDPLAPEELEAHKHDVLQTVHHLLGYGGEMD